MIKMEMFLPRRKSSVAIQWQRSNWTT